MRSRLPFAYAGIFVLAGSIIMFQIALTRVFAILMWHHFTYMVVSIAMLGFGAAGSILTARRDSLRGDDPMPAIARSAWGYGLALMVAFCFATLVRIDTLRIWEEKSNVVALLLFYLIIAAPMLLGGLAIGRALTRMSEKVHQLYFADLAGSAAGGAVSVALLSAFGSTTTVMIAGGLGVLSGLLFACAAPLKSRLAALPAVAIGVLVVVGFLGGSEAIGLPKLTWPVPFAPGKDILDLQEGADAIETRLPSSTAEVQVTRELPGIAPMIGGNFPVDVPLVEARYVGQDGTAPTMLYRDAADVEKYAEILRSSQAGAGYVAFEGRGGTSPDVLVIGVGGGVDVMLALAWDAAHVTAVEINKAMIRMVTERYADYIGGLFTPGAHPLADRIELINREGRSYMRHREDRYDVIQMAGVDSFTALSTGAYTLSESYLYTVEAVKEFYAHLKDDGYVNYSRFVLTHPRRPRETLRLVNIARTALEEAGVEDPQRNILVFQGDTWASTLIKRGAFTEAEVRALQAFAEQHGYGGLLHDPLRAEGGAFAAPGTDVAEARRVLADVIAPELAQPLGLEIDDERAAAALARALSLRLWGRPEAAEEVVVAWLEAEVAPERRAAVRERAERLLALAERHRVPDEGFRRDQETFARVLDADAERRERFIAAYPFDLSPSTDDSPFFFNYYRSDWKAPAGSATTASLDDNARRYNPDVPVGHRVLQASLVQIGLLAFVLIILPLTRLRRAGVPTPGKWRYLAYFGSLGLGYMFVEIVMMQKMVIFLGHPTYAISVVLTALLGFSGLGSFFAARFGRIDRRKLLVLMVAIALAIGFELLIINLVLPSLLGWSLSARIAAVVVMIAPLGFVLGMPFPCGIRILERNCPQLLPWGWAINGFLSVLASILCIVLSQDVGFTRVLALAGAVYAVGFLAMKTEEERTAPAVPTAPRSRVDREMLSTEPIEPGRIG